MKFYNKLGLFIAASSQVGIFYFWMLRSETPQKEDGGMKKQPQKEDGATRKQPHILFILADDFGWNDVGYHGSDLNTPTLDHLAGEGVKLENYYVQPSCSPSRSQLMSGLYQIRTGLQHMVIRNYQPNGLHPKFTTLAQKLKQVGYSTHIVGKWHLGFFKKEYTPLYRGFDSFYGYLGGAEDYWSHVYEGGVDFYNNTQLLRKPSEQYSTHLYANRAREIVRAHDKNKPLFLYLPLQSVHGPPQVPEYYLNRSKSTDEKRRIYGAMVSIMDEAIKNVTEEFKVRGLWDNTVTVFSTDNGGLHRMRSSNYPLRGGKLTLWEGGVRAVGFVNSPLLQKKSYVNQQLMHVSDWFPTLVHLAGGSTEGMKLDGVDQWETMSENRPSRRAEILHNIDALEPPLGERRFHDSFNNRIRAAIRVGDMKLLTGNVGDGRWTPPPHLTPPRLLSEGNHDRTKNVWLFNVTADPGERLDLSGAHPHLVRRLLDRLAAYNASAVPCVYPPDDPESHPSLHGGAWGPWRS